MHRLHSCKFLPDGQDSLILLKIYEGYAKCGNNIVISKTRLE